eukprot:TRINITY_DN16820_c0_g1_i1.p1 TRINITY_DN16820_c0_g1~~TRINITY_DN16820_c0_g1_i1.p1  ORF type:complete len:175 (+),score=54.60 TRINITY_DN16820_c0_g1_i1:39-527(+)
MSGEDGVVQRQEEEVVYDEGVDLMSKGLLGSMNAPLCEISEKLDSVQNVQEKLALNLRAERQKFEGNADWEYISEVFSKVPQYVQKLADMQTKMQATNETVAAMKIRADKIKQKKLKVIAKEQQLAAKPSKALLKQQTGYQFEQTPRDKNTLLHNSKEELYG